MLGYGCGVSMYTQFFVEDLKTYHMLPRPYMRSFDGEPADQLLKKKWVLDLANRAEAFLLESIEPRIMSDDSKVKIFNSILVYFETKTGEGKRNSTLNMQNW